MICLCCGNWITTTAGCIHCMATTWCASCGAKFCTNHGQDWLRKHFDSCPGIQKIGEIVFPSTHEWTDR